MFAPRKGLSFISDFPSSIHNWKTQFFFVSSTLSWGFSFIWGTPNTNPNDNNCIDAANQEDFLKLKDIKVLMQRELLIDQALYDVGLDLVTTAAMHPPSSLSMVDIHRYMGKRKSTTSEGSSRAAKKKKPDVPTVAAADQTDLPSVGAQDVSIEVPPSVEEQDDDVVVVEAPSALVEPTMSQVSSMFEAALKEQQPVATQAPLSPYWMLALLERLSSQRQGKAPATSTGSGVLKESQTSSSSSRSVNIQIPIGESALHNPALARHLIEAILLPVDKWIQKSWTLAEFFFFLLFNDFDGPRCVGTGQRISSLHRYLITNGQIIWRWSKPKGMPSMNVFRLSPIKKKRWKSGRRNSKRRTPDSRTS
ncbi:hypothetical protein COCNU_01G002750 [Cocos nucifera]|uniref:Uncharacterized protein n=1 Tax=Cocos nucifera TaxID=13894 RepID=A0A8K0HTH1_COCNU|nr:hypothetical protein COCNU_01G002750 [Cocos nucifera]